MDATAVKTLLDATRREVKVITDQTGLTPFALVPAGFEVKSLENLRTTLDRIEQKVNLLTADSFVAYWQRFAKGDSVIFADERTGTYTAVIDYHAAAGSPAWCEHVGTFVALPSREWETWVGNNAAPMPQADFALFIEDNAVDIFAPPAADMIAVAMNLSAKKSVDFASSIRLSDGQTQLVYQEQISGTSERAQGSMKIPEGFVIRIPVLLGGGHAEVQARLRYRINQGKLSMWYDLHRAAQIRDTAIRETSDAIRKALGSAPFYLGSRA